MKPMKKMSFLLIVAALATVAGSRFIPETLLRPASENPLIRSIKQKINAFAGHLPEERLYLQTDKPLYEPGDDIWLTAWLRDGISLKPSAVSGIVHVELINPRGGVEKKISLIAGKGKAAGDFQLDRQAPGGIYKLKAYTNWMKNEPGLAAFEKEIQVQDVILPNLKMKLDFEKKAFGAGDMVMAKIQLNTNENKALTAYKLIVVASLEGKKISEQQEITDAGGLAYIRFRLPAELHSNDGLLNIMVEYNGNTESISRSIPIVRNKIKFNLFPEGGDLVEGIYSNVAFRALNEFGKPADVEGVVMSSKGTRVATFSSYHQGMGSFGINPQPGEKYHVKITRPAGITETFMLPEALERGYVLGISQAGDNELTVNVHTTETEELSLVAQVRGEVCYTTAFPVLNGHSLFTVSSREFPAGVAQFTLFDSKGIARAERLVFVNRNRQMKITVSPGKEKYLPREKVRLNISVKDERGLPMPAHLSMAVVNDQLLSFADDRSGHLVSQFLLQQDLKEKIEDPAFYFKQDENKSGKALDYLMMTAGWRRFSWEQLMEKELPVITHQAEKTVVAGVLRDGMTHQPLPGAGIVVPGGAVHQTDVNGRFSVTNADLSQPLVFTFTATGYQAQAMALNDYRQDLEVYLYSNQHRHLKRSYLNDRGIPAMAMGAGRAMEAMPDAEMAFEEAPAIKEGRIVQPDRKKTVSGNKMVQDKATLKSEEVLASGARVVDAREKLFMAADDREGAVPGHQEARYYRARQYYAPSYEKEEVVQARTDFRNTIYWNPDIEIGYSGKKTIEFYASDNITSFNAVVEGFGNDGTPGRCESKFFTQLPFELSVKIPSQLVAGDMVAIPVTLKNNSGGPLGGLLTVTAPAGLKEMGRPQLEQTIMPGTSKTIYLRYNVLEAPGEADFSVGFSSCDLEDAISRKIKIVSKGFPAQVSFSGQEIEKEFVFELKNVVKGSIHASFSAFPDVVSDLLKGVEGILREPHGCFEQTSCTAYPNAMVLDYLKHTGSNDTRTLARATELLDRGYKRLTGFESPGKGYEWFGANPAHEGLTAYGIMEFVDMQKAGQEIDRKMLERTAQWLLSHRDGKGGFERERRALHDFGRISDDVMNAYIVYALSEAGYTDIRREFESSYAKAVQTRDPYLLALMANAAYSLKETQKGDACVVSLLEVQAKDGGVTGSSHSITYSQGQSLRIETTALTALALLKAPSVNVAALGRAVQFMVGARSGSGVFSSTQGTILALKALTAYAKFSKRTAEDGSISIYIDGKRVERVSYKAGEKEGIVIEGLEKYIHNEGKHTVKIKYENVKSALPYALAIGWNTTLPVSDEDCAVDIKTALASGTASIGETVRFSTTLSNRRNHDVPGTIAIIGLPAGLSAQPWQLKELQEKQLFDYYEISSNTIAFYYRGMAANAVKEIHLDLKAEIPGTYEAPAAVAYLYYTNELKTWTASGKIGIKETVRK